MGILDEAIREHLELKRKHGAEQGELRKLEDEAFGQAERPGGEGETGPSELEAAETQILSQIPSTEAEPESEGERAPDEVPAAEAAEEPGAVADSPGTSEREAIAQQPTEVFDVASELAREKGEERESDEVEVPPEAEASLPELEDPPPPPPSPSPSTDEEAQPEAEESAGTEPESETAAEPEPEAEAAVSEPEPDVAPQAEIFDDQSLSDELDQALENPADREERRAAFFEETDEFRAPTQRPSRASDSPDTSEEFPETSEEDVLEETPEFLEETPEHDRLWFEQKPPKDFDFND